MDSSFLEDRKWNQKAWNEGIDTLIVRLDFFLLHVINSAPVHEDCFFLLKQSNIQ